MLLSCLIKDHWESLWVGTEAFVHKNANSEEVFKAPHWAKGQLRKIVFCLHCLSIKVLHLKHAEDDKRIQED